MVEGDGKGLPLLLVLSVDSGLEFPSSSQSSSLKVKMNPLSKYEQLWFPGESAFERGLAGERGGGCLLKPSFWHRTCLGGRRAKLLLPFT